MFGLSPNASHSLHLHPLPPIRVSYHSCLGGPRHCLLIPLATLRVGIQQCLLSLSSSPRKDHRSALHSSTVLSPFLGSWSLPNPCFNPYWNIHFAPYLFASAQIRQTLLGSAHMGPAIQPSSRRGEGFDCLRPRPGDGDGQPPTPTPKSPTQIPSTDILHQLSVILQHFPHSPTFIF